MVDGITTTPATTDSAKFSPELIAKIEKEAGSTGDDLNGKIDTVKEGRIAQRIHRQHVQDLENAALSSRNAFSNLWGRTSEAGLDNTDLSTGSSSKSDVSDEETTDKSFFGELGKLLYQHITGTPYTGRRSSSSADSSEAMVSAMMAQNPMMAIVLMLMKQIQKLSDKIDSIGSGQTKTDNIDDKENSKYTGPIIGDGTIVPTSQDNNSPQTVDYTVVAGDTLSSIAEKNKTTVADIQKLNPEIKDADKIDAGQVIKLPKAAQ